MTTVLLIIFAGAVALLGFAGMRTRAMRMLPPSTFAGVLVGLAISFIGLRPWITQFGAPLSIAPFVALLAAAACWAVVRNQVRITRHHVLWLSLMAGAFLLSFRAAGHITQEAIVTAAAVVVTVCLRVSVKGVMVGLLIAAYSMLISGFWFSALEFGPRLFVLGENPIWIARVGVLGAIACLFLFKNWGVRRACSTSPPGAHRLHWLAWSGALASCRRPRVHRPGVSTTGAARDGIRDLDGRDPSPGTDLSCGSGSRRPGTRGLHRGAT